MDSLKEMMGGMGLGNPLAMLSKFATPAGAAAAAATGLFLTFQNGAAKARELRMESQKLGTTVGMYRDLAWNARYAGVSLAEVTAGMEKVNATAQEAMTGGIGAQAYFAGLGIAPEQLARLQGNPAEIARLVAQRGNSAQQIQMFGSTNAAKAIAQSSSDNGHSRAANDALEATRLSFMEHPIDSLKEMGHTLLSGIAYYTQRAGRAYGGGLSFSEAGAQMDKEAREAEGKEALDRRNTALKEAGTKQGEGLLSVRELNAANARGEANNDFGNISALTGVSTETFRARAETQRMQKQQAFDSQFQNPYERQDAQAAIIGWQTTEGTLTGAQGYRAQWENSNQTAAAVAGTRSKAENVRNAMISFDSKFNDPNITGDIGSNTKRDAAREFGDTLTDYVEGLTKSGPQAGAYGVNTVQGASQLMGAEYQMDQSQETRRMVELLLQIAQNTGRVTKEQRDAVSQNLGFRYSDPISSIFGN